MANKLTENKNFVSDIRTLGFDYNPAGQITERTDTGGSFAFSGHTDQTSIYDHNALNPIIDITETGAVTRTLTPVWTDGNLTSDGERSFGYAEPRPRDARGGEGEATVSDPSASAGRRRATIAYDFTSNGVGQILSEGLVSMLSGEELAGDRPAL